MADASTETVSDIALAAGLAVRELRPAGDDLEQLFFKLTDPDVRQQHDVIVSLRHALIGLLAEQPASGWDLTRRFEELLGTVWPAGHPQIYGELRKLEADGFIEIDSEGPRRRKSYRATTTGIAEVRRWLTKVEVDHTLRLEPVLRSVFFWLMTPEELAAHLEREAAFYGNLAEKYRDIAAAKDRGEYGDSPQTKSIRIAAEAGIRLHEALGEWAIWAEHHQPNSSP